ncbi:hypothetical protein AK830_g10185 [Neonectria ditissima]|uniref:O-methylsterigmatocystin oxidoreductase n=1 Tax=Neonectria ditissima TaxID=78410 RepID=A0A0P7AQI2_9HYPO|nr:hypothetical protein AK830_g10185 [Neonectria ditissima]
MTMTSQQLHKMAALDLDVRHTLPLSSMTWSRGVLVVCVLVVVFLVFQAHAATRRPKNFPPGPRGMPFVGNLASIPLVKSYVTFAEWTKQYGPILGLKAGPLNLVVLQDPADIHELYDRRGATYAGRPYNYIALNHVFDPEVGQILLFQRNDRLLKRWKRPARWFLSQQGIDGLGPVMDAMSARCVRALADRPGDFVQHLRAWALATPLVALSGQADVSADLMRTYFYRQTLLTGLLEPGKTPPVDFIAPLRWVPERWAKWKRDARFVREHQAGFYGEMVAKAKAARERRGRGGAGAGEYVPVMERLMDEGMPETEVKWLAGGLLDAAFDTSSAAVMNFIVAMAGHPEVLARAQDEIEVVCEGRVPGGEDVAKLPYLKACMMERLLADAAMETGHAAGPPARDGVGRRVQGLRDPAGHQRRRQRVRAAARPVGAPGPGQVRPDAVPGRRGRRCGRGRRAATQQHVGVWRGAAQVPGRAVHDAGAADAAGQGRVGAGDDAAAGDGPERRGRVRRRADDEAAGGDGGGDEVEGGEGEGRGGGLGEGGGGAEEDAGGRVKGVVMGFLVFWFCELM